MQLVPGEDLQLQTQPESTQHQDRGAEFVIEIPTMRALSFAGALLALALSQPVETSIAQTPVPGGAPAVVQGLPGTPMPEEQLFKYALTQGGLTIVCLVLFWWIQRENKRQEAAKDEKAQILIALVEKNTTALVLVDQTNARLARAIESTRLLPPGAGV